MKAFARKAGIGLVWFVGFTVATNLLVRPLVRKAAAKIGQPQLGQLV